MAAVDHEKRAAFVSAYVACGNGTKAAVAAGVPQASAAVMGSRWLRNPEVAAMIRAEMDRALKTLAPVALRTIQAMIESDETPAAVRLSACRDILDRAHYQPPKRVEASVELSAKPFTQMTRTELEELVRQEQIARITSGADEGQRLLTANDQA